MIVNKRRHARADTATAALNDVAANHWLVRGLVSGFFIAALMTMSTADAKWYKWVDENGNVSYQDRPPPSDYDQSSQILNTQGVTVKRIPSKAEEDKLAEQQRIEAIRSQRDTMLMKSFPTENDLTQSRDKRLGHIDGTVTRMYDQMVILNSRLELIEGKIEKRVERGLAPSEALESDRSAVMRSINSTNALIKSKLKERRKVSKMFKEDLARYRELTQAEQSAQLEQ